MKHVTHSKIVVFTLPIFLLGCSKQPDFSAEKIKKIEAGMTLAEAEEIVGAKATRADQVELNKSNEKRKSLIDKFTRDGVTVWVWQRSKALLVVSVSNETKKITGKGFAGGTK